MAVVYLILLYRSRRHNGELVIFIQNDLSNFLHICKVWRVCKLKMHLICFNLTFYNIGMIVVEDILIGRQMLVFNRIFHVFIYVKP